MLDLTILKTTHATEKEAKKLLPYILESDVYSPEVACGEELEVQKSERDWRDLIASDKSRTAFRREYALGGRGRDPPDVIAYNSKALEYLFRSRTPIIYLERFPAGTGEIPILLQERSNVLCKEGMRKIILGNKEEALPLLWEGLRADEEGIEIRDREIARNILRLKELADFYHSLRGKSTLRVTVQVGSYHAPEHYLSFQPRVVDISVTRGTFDLHHVVNVAMKEGKSFSDLRPFFEEFATRYLRARIDRKPEPI